MRLSSSILVSLIVLCAPASAYAQDGDFGDYHQLDRVLSGPNVTSGGQSPRYSAWGACELAEPNEAISECTRLLDGGLYPKSDRVDVLILRADAYVSLGDFDRARADYDEAIQLIEDDPRVSNVLQRRPIYQLGLKRTNPLRQKYADALRKYANFSMLAGQHEETIPRLQEAVRLDPSIFRSHYLLGSAYLFAKNPDAATSSLLTAIKLNERPHAYRELGFAQVMRGDFTLALEAFQIADQRKPSGAPRALIAYGYSLIGRADKAARLLRATETLAESSEEVAPPHLALAYLAAGKFEESLHWFNASVENQAMPEGGRLILAIVAENMMSDPTLEQPEFVEMRNRLRAR